MCLLKAVAFEEPIRVLRHPLAPPHDHAPSRVLRAGLARVVHASFGTVATENGSCALCQHSYDGHCLHETEKDRKKERKKERKMIPGSRGDSTGVRIEAFQRGLIFSCSWIGFATHSGPSIDRDSFVVSFAYWSMPVDVTPDAKVFLLVF